MPRNIAQDLTFPNPGISVVVIHILNSGNNKALSTVSSFQRDLRGAESHTCRRNSVDNPTGSL